MANLNVRINHKFDTYSNWMNSDLILGKGELAIAEIPAATTDSGLTPPALGVKIGNGEKKFSKLNWIQATAGDVHAWAKAAKKPEYTADEIQNLADFIGRQIQDSNTEYTFEFTGDSLVVKQKGINETEYTDFVTLTIPLSTKIDKVANAVAGDVATMTADGQVADSGIKLADLATKADYATKQALADEISAVTEAAGKLTDRVAANEGDIKDLQDLVDDLTGGTSTSLSGKADKVTGAVAGNVASLNAEGNLVDGGVAVSALAKSADVAATYATKEELADEIEAVTGAASELAGRVTTAEGAIEALQGKDVELQNAINNKVQKVTGAVDNVVLFAADGAIKDGGVAISALETKANAEAVYATKEELADEVEAITGAATELAGRVTTAEGKITTLEGAVETLNGEGDGSVKKQVADAIAGVVASAPADFDTLKEIADYIASDKTGAAELSNRVSANETAIGTLEAASHSHANKETVLDNLTVQDMKDIRTAAQSISGVDATKTGTDIAITGISVDLLKNGAATLVFDCGTASTVL